MFVGVDVGASGTRYVNEEMVVHAIQNNTVFLGESDLVRIQPYSDEILSGLLVEITKDGKGEFKRVRALIGDMANRYSTNTQTPTCMKNKLDQRVNFTSIITSIALSMLQYGKTYDKIELYLALPPIEAQNGLERANEEFIGKYVVELPKFDHKFEFDIVSVKIYEESFLAMLSYFFELDGKRVKPKATSKEFGNGRVLSLDAGDATTDLAVVENLRYIEKSGQTYKKGGNIACESLINQVRAIYGFDMPMDQARRVLSEGRMEFGNGYKDVSTIVEKAKKEYARAIVNQIQNYFYSIDMPIQTIRAIVVSGGGSMQSQYSENGTIVVTTPSMSEYITDELRDVCDTIDVRQIDGNPRYANIQGLLVRINFDIARTYQNGSK